MFETTCDPEKVSFDLLINFIILSFFLLEWRGGKLEEIERSLQKSRPSVIISVKVMLVCNVFP